MATQTSALQQAQAVMAAAGAVPIDAANADQELYGKILKREKILQEDPEYLVLCQELAQQRVTAEQARARRREIALRLQAAGAFN